MKVEPTFKSNIGAIHDVIKVTIYLGNHFFIRRCELRELIKLLQEEEKLCHTQKKTSTSHPDLCSQ